MFRSFDEGAFPYLVTGELDTIKQSTTTLADYGQDNLGNRTSAAFGNGAIQAFTYDPVSRLASLSNNLTGTANDLTATFAYNPASQITTNVRTGDAYAWTGHGTGSTAYVSNGLNEQVTIGGAAATWDSKGNLTTEPQTGKTYGYSSQNQLTSATGGVTLGYDPLFRLYQVAGGTTTRFAYDGFDAIAEYNSSNALQRRFVFGPGVDEPIVQYEGTGTTNRRFMSADERGSIISLTDSSGALLNLNRYDEYGKPQTTNVGRFQYTGQKWIGEANLYDYKFRDYLPHLGIFAQTDPIGYEDSPNFYAYVGNDPVNLIDPLGLDETINCQIDVCVFGKRRTPPVTQQPSSASMGPLGIRPPGSSGNPAQPKPKKKPKPYSPNVNFCGAEGGAALPNSVGAVSINDICYAHDNCYDASGTPRSTCDARFGFAIKIRVSLYYGPIAFPTGALVGDLASVIGYGIVLFGGLDSYVPK